MHRKQELAAPGDPPRTVRRQRARRHQAVQMEVGPQLLVPRVQHEREAHLAAEVLAAELQQGFGRRVEQQVQQGPLVALAVEDQRVQVVRQGEHVVKVRHRQEFFQAGVHPGGRGHALALRAMAVAATVVRQPLEPARRAPLAMAAQRRGPAMLDVPHRLPLGARQAMRLPVRLAVLPKDVGQFAADGGAAAAASADTGSEDGVHSSTSPSPGRRNRSSGLRIDSKCWLVTCKYLAVVLKLVCPISRWIIGNGTPASIKWVANECRRQWMPCPCWIPARALAASKSSAALSAARVLAAVWDPRTANAAADTPASRRAVPPAVAARAACSDPCDPCPGRRESASARNECRAAADGPVPRRASRPP